MTPEQAISYISIAADRAIGNRQEHINRMSAINVIKEFIVSKEEKKDDKKEEKNSSK